jgi:hypothetical protein
MDEDLGEEEDGYKKAKNRKRQRSAGGGGAGGYLLDDFASIGAGGGGGGGAVVVGGDDTGAQGSLLLCLPSCLPSRLVAGMMHKQQQLIAWLVRHASVSNVLCLPTCPAPRCPAESVGAAVPRQKAASRQYIEDMYLQRKRRRERYK